MAELLFTTPAFQPQGLPTPNVPMLLDAKMRLVEPACAWLLHVALVRGDYGWCVFQAETARCGGVAAPSEAARNPSTCLGCANFVVDERHRGYWQGRRRRNVNLLDQASALTRPVLDTAIGECNHESWDSEGSAPHENTR